MANNYLQFSEVLSNLTVAERDWLQQQLETVYVFGDTEYAEVDIPRNLSLEDAIWCGCRALRDLPDEDCDPVVGFQCEFAQDDDLGLHLWFYAEEAGEPQQVAHVVQKFLLQFRPEQSWSLTYATTCSKLRISEFSGGALFVTAEAIESFDAGDFTASRQRAFDLNHPSPSRSLP